MDEQRRTVSLPIHCHCCGRAVTVLYRPPTAGAERKIFGWICPYDGCAGWSELSLHGEYLGASKGHGTPPPSPRR